jgi:hypothetical protein
MEYSWLLALLRVCVGRMRGVSHAGTSLVLLAVRLTETLSERADVRTVVFDFVGPPSSDVL